MTPSTTIQNRPHGGTTNNAAYEVCNVVASHFGNAPKLSDTPNLFFSDFRPSVSFALNDFGMLPDVVGITSIPSASTFGLTISHILRVCTKPQMVRVYARRIIAFVKDAHRCGIDAVMKVIRPAMCFKKAFPNVDIAVIVGVPRSAPLPTSTIGFNNATPEFFSVPFNREYEGFSSYGHTSILPRTKGLA